MVDDSLQILEERRKSRNIKLKRYTNITYREWVIAAICSTFKKKSDGKIPFTEIGKNLPEICPDLGQKTCSAQAINSELMLLKKKLRKALATYYFVEASGYFSNEELAKIRDDAIKDVRKHYLECTDDGYILPHTAYPDDGSFNEYLKPEEMDLDNHMLNEEHEVVLKTPPGFKPIKREDDFTQLPRIKDMDDNNDSADA